ncbi:hypothetical protein EON65_31685 [archaeon]|nr:MAG: hypothetical protein EON65_31685 [archaeon]
MDAFPISWCCLLGRQSGSVMTLIVRWMLVPSRSCVYVYSMCMHTTNKQNGRLGDETSFQ